MEEEKADLLPEITPQDPAEMRQRRARKPLTEKQRLQRQRLAADREAKKIVQKLSQQRGKKLLSDVRTLLEDVRHFNVQTAGQTSGATPEPEVVQATQERGLARLVQGTLRF